jgi:hypothetical protein
LGLIEKDIGGKAGSGAVRRRPEFAGQPIRVGPP